MKNNTITRLPDGSAFTVVSTSLPEEHWLYQYDTITHCRLAECTTENERRDCIRRATQQALRSATGNGADMDLDPDALVANMIVALFGPYPTPQQQST